MTGSLATHTLAGRAELLRILTEEDEALREATAGQFGFIYTRRRQDQIKPNLSVGQTTPNTTGASGEEKVSQNHESAIWQPAPTLFWRAETVRLIGDGQQSETREQLQKRLNPTGQIVPPPIADLSTLAETLPVIRPLSPVHGVTTRLRAEVLSPQPAGIDLDKIVSRLSRGEFLQRVPRQMRGTLGSGFSVWIDRSIRLTPYWDDQTLVTFALLRLFPRDGTTVAMLSEGDRRLEIEYPDHLAGRIETPSPGTTVIVLGDLGCLQVQTRQAVRFWIKQGLFLRKAGCRAIAVVPCDRSCIPSELARLWTIIPWDTTAAPGSDEARKANVDRLLGLLAHARRIEPGLIRDLRRLLPEARNCPGLEATLWQNSSLSSRQSEGATLDLRVLKKLRERFDGEPEWLKEQVADLLRHWRPQVASIWCEEAHSLLSGKNAQLLPEAEQAEIARFFTELADWAEKNPRQSAKFSHVMGWLNRAVRRSPGLERGHSPATEAMNRIAALVCADDPTVEPLGGMNPDEIPPSEDDAEFAAKILLIGKELRFDRDKEISADTPHSLLGTVRSRNGRIAIHSGLNTQADDPGFDIDRDFWDGEAPAWAGNSGIDEFGAWVELVVDWTTSGSHTQFDTLIGKPHPRRAVQKLRWIPAGKFFMGSPEDEPGRYDDEGPQHEVTIAKGFWMFDTPCTQAFYRAVTGENKSKFKSPDRPVETVSWNDAQKFLEQIRSLEPGIEIGLPTEAEWEYACRAGTTEATYAGPIEILGDANSPILDDIGWYGGNSNVGFELENGQDASDWLSDRQHGDKGGRSGTHPVKKKGLNPWGLSDMLGNVFEWCEDTKNEKAYERGAATDPLEKSSGASANRVIRGGSWDSGARRVRAAYRSWLSPEDRNRDLGFRCRVRGAEPSQAAAEQAEQARKQARAGKGGSPERAVSRRSGRAEPRGDSSPASGERPTASGSVIERPTWIQLIDRHEASTPVPQGPVAKIISDVEELTLRRISRPDWASAIGRDEFGLWAEFSISGPGQTMQGEEPRVAGSLGIEESQLSPVVSQRLRWIPPGRFHFGSPKDEPFRANNEFLPTTHIVSEGFWLFDTPCTQELWLSVFEATETPHRRGGTDNVWWATTSLNDSDFKSPTRPVENVSWSDCHEFMRRLKLLIPGLVLCLPSETEWEYACRAGTTETTYAGPFVNGSNTQAVLDSIAWYWGNSDADFDLDGEKGTHSVGGKSPNPWGLYDMLGNVYEWCSDVGRMPNESVSEEVDEASADRVIRGGSWDSNAQDVRAAGRSWSSPEDRRNALGFRCRVREFKPSEESSDAVSAKRRSP